MVEDLIGYQVSLNLLFLRCLCFKGAEGLRLLYASFAYPKDFIDKLSSPVDVHEC